MYIYSFMYIVDICFFWNTSLILFGCPEPVSARRRLGFSMVKLFFVVIKQSKVYKPEYSSCSINTIYRYIHKYTFHVQTFLFNTLQCERHLFRYM